MVKICDIEVVYSDITKHSSQTIKETIYYSVMNIQMGSYTAAYYYHVIVHQPKLPLL